jgi:hypothetical protein
MQLFAAHSAGGDGHGLEAGAVPWQRLPPAEWYGPEAKMARASERPCSGQGLAQLSPTDSVLADIVRDIARCLAKASC